MVNQASWWLSACLLIVAPLPFLGAISLLRVRVSPLWLGQGLNGAGLFLTPLAGALSIMALARELMKGTHVRRLAFASFLLAAGGLVGLGSVFLKGSFSLGLLLLIPATGMIGLSISLSGLLNRLGMVVAMIVAACCSLLLVISLFSLLSILVIYLWPVLGLGLLLRHRAAI